MTNSTWEILALALCVVLAYFGLLCIRAGWKIAFPPKPGEWDE